MTVLLLLFLLLIFNACTDVKTESVPIHQKAAVKQDAGIGTINGIVIERAEFEFLAKLQLAMVYSYFKVNYDLDAGPDFWSWDKGEEAPLEVLKKRTLNECFTVKSKQILARDKGIPVSLRFSEFKANREAENLHREKNLKTGQPVYGTKQFSMLQYHLYIQTNLENHLRLALQEKPKKGEKNVPGGLPREEYHKYIGQLKTDAVIKLNQEVVQECLGRVTGGGKRKVFN
jgi:hypothetical protein